MNGATSPLKSRPCMCRKVLFILVICFVFCLQTLHAFTQSRGGLSISSTQLRTTGTVPVRISRSHTPTMVFGFGRRKDGSPGHEDNVDVRIEAPSMNSRKISGSIVIDRPVDDVWKILSDYDHLADNVPNLTQSKLVPHPTGGIRLFQEGAQKIIGFDFRASLTMDMTEVMEKAEEKFGQRKILFKLVESAMFNGFDGEWSIQNYSRIKNPNPTGTDDQWIYTSKVFYSVVVKPRGPVPVAALEWQIKSEVPNNLRAVKLATERLPCSAGAYVPPAEAHFDAPPAVDPAAAAYGAGGGGAAKARTGAGVAASGGSYWEEDETLDMYVEKQI
uniref:Coenzyme Q-binding protein COQ10 START domain-containing protein n=1 Tax=Heterosigma akashiwo TaxID=2829 RepID=A0A6V1KTJ0_HETAK|mmetsp:Transcript_59284/g.86776  ORF Transcript_59284/g.86776 Transcript_59284/m.86776 type:complete len:331 (-) Transcript_59284:443-1435(-)